LDNDGFGLETEMAERDLYPSEKQDRFIVRLPDGMRDRIKAVAEANNRSMNAEIVATLEEKYPEPEFDLSAFMLEMSKKFAETHDPEELGRLVGTANLELEKRQTKWRVHVQIDGDEIALAFVGPAVLGSLPEVSS
jgi:hypothetical protein